MTRMFYGCTNIEKITCNITGLNTHCLQYMFSGCSKLSYIAFPSLTNGSYGSLADSEFSTNVATNGTFVKKAGTDWRTGTSGIPSGWTVIEV